MHKVSRKAHQARKWGAGCACHEEELIKNKSVTCNKKGRRLKEAGLYVRQFSSDCMTWASEWDLH